MTRVDHSAISLGATGTAVPPADDALIAGMGRFASGVTVLTTPSEAGFDAVTVSAFVPVSLRPALVACSIRQPSRFLRRLVPGVSFAINVLAAGQEEIARRFANPARARGPEAFQGVTWCAGRRSDAPLLHGALAWLECSVEALVVAGDHVVVMARVSDVTVSSGLPLITFAGVRGTFHSTPLEQRWHQHQGADVLRPDSCSHVTPLVDPSGLQR